ncbi:MAG: GIY-YIG nuclease family protein [Natronomonas sp.]
MTGGTYTLVMELKRAVTIEIGALGTHQLPAGWYAYTGSALGSGGFSRVDRHYELAAGERSTRHWHIDYLLGHEAASIRGDVRTPGADIECVVAMSLPFSPVGGFGASDCDCSSHLAYASDGKQFRENVAAAHREADRE